MTQTRDIYKLLDADTVTVNDVFLPDLGMPLITLIIFSSLSHCSSFTWYALFWCHARPSTYSHVSLGVKDLDKTQTGIMRHHSSISELKRSFMESVPEPRPSEWDKRLSTNSPFRTASINGLLQPSVSPNARCSNADSPEDVCRVRLFLWPFKPSSPFSKDWSPRSSETPIFKLRFPERCVAVYSLLTAAVFRHQVHSLRFSPFSFSFKEKLANDFLWETARWICNK